MFEDERYALQSVTFSSPALTHGVQNRDDLDFLQAGLLENSASASGRTLSYAVTLDFGPRSHPFQAYVHREAYRIDFAYEFKLGLYEHTTVDFSGSPSWMETIRVLRDRPLRNRSHTN